MTSKIKTIVLYGMRAAAIAYFGSALANGTIDGSITQILLGGAWGLTEVVNVGIYMLGKAIPIATLDTALKGFKTQVGDTNFNALLSFVKDLDFSGLVNQVNDLGLNITDVLALLKANALVANEKGLYDDFPETKELIETITK